MDDLEKVYLMFWLSCLACTQATQGLNPGQFTFEILSKL